MLTVGKLRGRMSNKDNRAAKLISQWDELRDKFTRMIERGRCQTERSEHSLGLTPHSRYAYACLLMMETGIRIGNESSAEGFVRVGEHNLNAGDFVQTFGLTTLLGRHVTMGRKTLSLSFTGKKVVEQCLAVENSTLIHYAPCVSDDDLWLGVEANRLRKFVTRFVGRGFTPKDLRTAKVNLVFLEQFDLDEYIACPRKSDRNRVLSVAIEKTAEVVGHTSGVCRNSYLSKMLLDSIRQFGL